MAQWLVRLTPDRAGTSPGHGQSVKTGNYKKDVNSENLCFDTYRINIMRLSMLSCRGGGGGA